EHTGVDDLTDHVGRHLARGLDLFSFGADRRKNLIDRTHDVPAHDAPLLARSDPTARCFCTTTATPLVPAHITMVPLGLWYSPIGTMKSRPEPTTTAFAI